MELSSIEVRRARHQLDAFCQRRSRVVNGGPRWHFTQHENRFELFVADVAVVRLCFDGDVWHLEVPCAAGGWLDYPPRPRLERIDAVIDELEQAPLHVHW